MWWREREKARQAAGFTNMHDTYFSPVPLLCIVEETLSILGERKGGERGMRRETEIERGGG